MKQIHCSVDNCHKPHHGKSFCRMHLTRFTEHGDPLISLKPRHIGCSIESCTGKHKSKGLCQKHFHRMTKYGDTAFTLKPRIEVCLADGCSLKAKRKGYCPKHFYKFKKYGDATYKIGANCSIQGCSGAYKAKGFCQFHYSSYKYSGDPIRPNKEFTPLSFWSKIAITANPEKCWTWQGRREPKGYGRFNLVTEKVKFQLAHRVAYFLFYGKDPKELFVCHKCDNPICCNPHHFFLGTHQENMADKISKKRHFRVGKISTLFSTF